MQLKIQFLFLFQVEFFLTNLGPRNYFTVLAKESSSGFSARGGQGEFGFGESQTDFINFPLPSFLAGLSEVKPYLDEGETRTIVLSITVPLEAELGVRKVIFLEVQPFGNNAAGNR